MNAAAIAAALTEALEAAAAKEAGAPCVLVSLNFNLIGAPAPGQARASVARKTRTLVFMHADFIGPDGAAIASAASVHRLTD